MGKTAASIILLIAVVANSTPLVQNQQLANAEKEIRSQLTDFFEGENVQDAKAKAKQVSDRIVAIYDDASLTITQKAQKVSQVVRETVENTVGQVNQQNLDDAMAKIMTKITGVYAPYLESLKENETFQKGWNFVSGLLQGDNQ